VAPPPAGEPPAGVNPARGRPALSALVVAHNEEKMLGACLASLTFADEVVVVLDRCTDGSAGIAAASGARIIEGAWPLEGPRRHAGIEACRGPWILEVDADERVTPALAAEIREAIGKAPSGALLIPFANYIGVRLIRHGWGAYNGVAGKYCLFSKGAKRWREARVHPGVALTGARGRLQNAMEHRVDADLTAFFARLNRYTDLHAQDLVDQGKAPGAWQSTRRVFSRAWKSYVARQGYKEGFYGVALALFSGLYPLFLYLKARELAERRDHADGRAAFSTVIPGLVPGIHREAGAGGEMDPGHKARDDT
jgi:glycosyltransferase involved in cell wall biosynthesis